MKLKKLVLYICIAAMLMSTVALFGCAAARGSRAYSQGDGKSIASIEKTPTENGTAVTVEFGDGTTFTFTVENGRDGVDGKSFSVDDVYAAYVERYPDATYEEFVNAVVAVNADEGFTASNIALKSSLKVYTEFTERMMSGGGWRPTYTTETNIYCGSAVIYAIDVDYTYIVTNYHVVYDNASVDATKLAKRITCYLYGSESEPAATRETDASGCTVYDYGDYGIPCEYVGGCVTADIAVVRARTDDVFAVNDNARPAEFADGYAVGQSAIAIGNSENEGISVTSGIVSVDNENIALSIDGTARYYRSLRIDTAIYSGNSGGGLFDKNGRLIGITNAGDGENQNINYAIPVNIVKPVVENIMKYKDGTVKKITLGITAGSKECKYIYDPVKGCGAISETVLAESVEENSIAAAMGLRANDIVKSIAVGETVYAVTRHFDIGDILYNIAANDIVYITYVRNGTEIRSTEYTVKSSDLRTVA